MKRALALASLGLRKTSPNPLVGCVIVKDGQIIGEGWHRRFGGPHAEIEAINDAKSHGHDVKDSTLYVNLEPCSHWGKTPPCANRLIDEGISEVVIAMRDPNPKVNGKGIEILRSAGIKVTELKEFKHDAVFLNRGFLYAQKHSRPFITIKAAVSLDGKMCLANGSSKWITGSLARVHAHALRAENDAVVVGVNTVIADDPELTVRHVTGINPLRVILDSRLHTPTDAKVIGTDGKCLIFAGYKADYEKEAKLRDAGAEIIRLPYYGPRVDIGAAMKPLVERGVLNLMVEGGPGVISTFMRYRLADYLKMFIAPRVLGEGKGFNLKMNFEDVAHSYRLVNQKTTLLGNDTMIEGILTCSPD
ncbi:MAG: bifunctional diaminohydroxyphosphoribosylaminopyrimidine deaminase/5-amino-6-(5-phosphoribosylamino)uracil reductase RibD [Synergistaceae bacterium]|nr:bifunctional diaminohydroxyphosphoribosylaminopyrimidine deaminase/5-amino-6-(5-phosphoribosylamino)uracil reductase RibD [Synergistaceae bacterium]